MKITIPTIYREGKNYLKEMLDSMISTSNIDNIKIEFFIGNETKQKDIEKQILEYNRPEFKVYKFNSEETKLLEGKTTSIKFNYNFSKCISSGNYTEDILYLEDDIKFTDRWLIKLNKYISYLDRHYRGKYILSLYAPFEFNTINTYEQIEPGHFYGTQGIYVKKHYQEKLFHKIYDDGIINYRHQADLLLDEFAKENKIPIFCLTTSLIQHIGEQSTGLGNFHKTNNFKEL